MAARLTVAGYRQCSFFVKAANVAASLEHLFPSRIKVSIIELPDRDSYKKWLPDVQGRLNQPAHKSSPITWLNEDEYIGGCDDTLQWARENFVGAPGSGGVKKAKVAIDDAAEEKNDYDYDLVVIGGGSGGLACSKEAKKLGAKVCVLDYVKPSPAGSSWGLGGTCVNVGCIPKKLMHQAALLGEAIKGDAEEFGWDVKAEGHNWERMVGNVQDHIEDLNSNYKRELRDKDVEYKNLLGTFVDDHTLELTDPSKDGMFFPERITARRIVVAVGGRPNRLGCPGGELAIDSDDIFSLKKSPGKTLVVGGAYIALECGGFLTALGLDTSIMVRSILLRGFDREYSDKIGEYMEKSGTKFIRGAVPEKIEKQADGRLKVSWEGGSDIFDTVFSAIGRKADTKTLGLDKAGVAVDAKSGKIVCKEEQTSCPHIYAIGDVVHGELELTPVAIQAGRFLARRLFGGSTQAMDYTQICTTVFTPLEYGCCGLSEEDAIKEFGEDAIEVFHTNFTPLEWAIPEERQKGACHCKLICNKGEDMKVVGFHFLGPNAGEVTQGVGVAMKLGANYQHFVDTVGIHPTSAETFTTLSVTKASGESADDEGC